MACIFGIETSCDECKMCEKIQKEEKGMANFDEVDGEDYVYSEDKPEPTYM